MAISAIWCSCLHIKTFNLKSFYPFIIFSGNKSYISFSALLVARNYITYYSNIFPSIYIHFNSLEVALRKAISREK